MVAKRKRKEMVSLLGELVNEMSRRRNELWQELAISEWECVVRTWKRVTKWEERRGRRSRKLLSLVARLPTPEALKLFPLHPQWQKIISLLARKKKLTFEGWILRGRRKYKKIIISHDRVEGTSLNVSRPSCRLTELGTHWKGFRGVT